MSQRPPVGLSVCLASSMTHLVLSCQKGEGAYSSVYSVIRQSDGVQYALKKVKMGKLSDKEKENALNEVRILASIKHKNICAYHEAFVDESTSSLW